MVAVNEAYRVLRNPVRRAQYDASLAPSRPPPGASYARQSTTSYAPTTAAADRAPARYPWKLVGVLAVLGTGGVLAGAALRSPSTPARPDNVLRPGSCVTIEANRDAREVTCSGVDDLVVVELVAFDGVCPAGLSAYRDRQGMGFACVSRRTTTSVPEG